MPDGSVGAMIIGATVEVGPWDPKDSERSESCWMVKRPELERDSGAERRLQPVAEAKT